MNKLALPLFVIISLVSVWGIARSSQLSRQVKLLEEANLHASQPLAMNRGPTAAPTPAPVILTETVSKPAPNLISGKSSDNPSDLLAQLQQANAELTQELAGYKEQDQEKAERLVEEEKRREERRVERSERAAKAASNVMEQFELLGSIDTSNFPPKYAEAHQSLLGTLASIQQKMLLMSQNPENRDEIKGSMHDEFMNLRDGLDITREALMYDMVTQDLGFQEDEAKLILEDINLLNDITDMGRMMRGMWGGRGPGGNRGGGGGPPPK